MIRYQTICSNLLKDLPLRTNEIIKSRFGLDGKNRETLEAIGKRHNITRERVRQIEAEGILKIKPKIKKYSGAVQHFNNVLSSSGGVRKENSLLFVLGGKKYQNQALFLLNLADGFENYPETADFHSLWAQSEKSLNRAKKIVNLTIKRLKKEKTPLSLDELFKIQKSDISKILGKDLNKDVFSFCIEISKRIKENSDCQLGMSHWVEISPKGIKDKAYLILKKQASPLHFSKITSLIENSKCFGKKKAHKATVHNELIKDSRFVLVGRGIYGLSEWGYEPGVVKDVILKVLKQSGRPMPKETIVRLVSEQRFVKANTIVLNLQDKTYFLKNEKGEYSVKEN